MDQTSHSGLPFGVPLPPRPPREAIDALLREDPAAARSIEVGIPMRDGVELAADVHLPPGVQLPAPAIVIGTPYDKSGPFDATRLYRDAGYAHVIYDSRGRGKSEGEWRALTLVDGQDGHDVVEWVAAAGVVQRRRRRHRPQLQRLGRVGDHGGTPAAPARRRLHLCGGSLAAGAALHLRLLLALLGLLVRARAPPHPRPYPRPPGAAADACPSARSATCSTARGRAGRSSSSTTRSTSCGRAAAGTAPTTSTSRRCT